MTATNLSILLLNLRTFIFLQLDTITITSFLFQKAQHIKNIHTFKLDLRGMFCINVG